MIDTGKRFAHVILFECPHCKGPLASAFSSLNETMECLDGGQFSAVCRCGWMGSGLDLLAVKKSVQPWEVMCETVPVQSEPMAQYFTNPRDWLYRVAQQIASFAHKS